MQGNYLIKIVFSFQQNKFIIVFIGGGVNVYLIVGLGNPGREYKHTHHNMGFDVVDKFADSLGVAFDRTDFKGLYVKARYMDNDLIILKPQTYMNLSGESIIQVLNFYKIPIENMIVVYDDMDTPLGHIKLKIKGSSGGHNGIKSIIANLGTEEFNRIKVGIGHPESHNIIDYVLKRPSKEEEPLIYAAQKNAVEALKVALSDSFNKAMTMYNK